jgi:hypothetical protein
VLLGFLPCVLAPAWGFAQAHEPAAARVSAAGRAAAEPTLSEAKRRALERRREREENRPWITVPELEREAVRGLLGDPAVAILDVTCGDQAAKFRDRIPGATWHDWARVEQWAPRYRKDQTIVVYCA